MRSMRNTLNIGLILTESHTRTPDTAIELRKHCANIIRKYNLRFTTLRIFTAHLPFGNIQTSPR